MADIVHNSGLTEIGDFTSLDVRAALFKSSVTPTKDHDFLSDLTTGSGEISVTGYVRQTLSGKTATVDDTNDLVKLTFDTIQFTGLSGADQTAGWLTLYIHNASDAAAQLLITFDVTDVALGTTNTSRSYAPSSNGIRLRQGA